MPVAAIREDRDPREIVGRGRARSRDRGDGWFDVEIALAAATVGDDAGQLLNMLYGNTSLQDDVVSPTSRCPTIAGAVRRAAPGLAGPARARRRGTARADLFGAEAAGPFRRRARRTRVRAFARGGVDFIKDDHGLADQAYRPFAERVAPARAAVRARPREHRAATRYVAEPQRPLRQMRARSRSRATRGSTRDDRADDRRRLDRCRRWRATIPTSRSSRIRRWRARRASRRRRWRGCSGSSARDAVIFPNYGGRFGYSPRDLPRAGRRVARALGRLERRACRRRPAA